MDRFDGVILKPLVEIEALLPSGMFVLMYFNIWNGISSYILSTVFTFPSREYVTFKSTVLKFCVVIQVIYNTVYFASVVLGFAS